MYVQLSRNRTRFLISTDRRFEMMRIEDWTQNVELHQSLTWRKQTNARTSSRLRSRCAPLRESILFSLCSWRNTHLAQCVRSIDECATANVRAKTEKYRVCKVDRNAEWVSSCAQLMRRSKVEQRSDSHKCAIISNIPTNFHETKKLTRPTVRTGETPFLSTEKLSEALRCVILAGDNSAKYRVQLASFKA